MREPEDISNFNKLVWTNRFAGKDRGRNRMPDVF